MKLEIHRLASALVTFLVIHASAADGQDVIFDMDTLRHRPGEVLNSSRQKVPVGTAELVNGKGESAAPSNSDSGATSAELAGTDKHARIAELLSQARSMLDVDNPEAALACFDRVLALEPDHSEALVKKGAALERLHKLNEAIECYDHAIAVDATVIIAYLRKGGLCNRLERYKEVLECYEEPLRTHHQ